MLQHPTVSNVFVSIDAQTYAWGILGEDNRFVEVIRHFVRTDSDEWVVRIEHSVTYFQTGVTGSR